MNSREFKCCALSITMLFATGCAPGYLEAHDLERAEQGPTHCAKRCHELGMEMGALVLVANQLPGCVCQPRGTAQRVSENGAAAATAGYGVMLAAAAAAQAQMHQQQQHQRQMQIQSQRH